MLIIAPPFSGTWIEQPAKEVISEPCILQEVEDQTTLDVLVLKIDMKPVSLKESSEKQNHSEKSDASLPKQARTPLDRHPEHPILNLQQSIGNQAVMRLMQPQTGDAVGEHKAVHGPATPSSPAILQTKLELNEPGDSYEQEADHMADQVMRTAD